jgi:hypothetical protein
MNIKKIASSTLLFGTLFLLSGLSHKIKAQTDISLSVSPPISYLQVPPGTTRNHTVVLENKSDKAITVTPSIVDFSPDGKTGRAIISNELSFPYITFGISDIKDLSIPAHKKAQLTLYMDIPQDASEREYPLTILFFSKNETPAFKINESNSKITGAIGSNLVVLVSKESKLSQVLRVIDTNTPRFIDSFGRIEFSPLVKNESFASVAASGSAKILNWKKDIIVEFDIYPDIVLGSNTRELRALRPGISSDKPETGVFSYKPKLLLGPYQIVINIENNQESNSQHVEVVYAFPFSITLIILVGVAVGFIYYKKIKNTDQDEMMIASNK